MNADSLKTLSGPTSALLILLITGSVHFVGSAVLFGVTSGIGGLLASPLLAIFGWFFVVPEFIGVTVQWIAYKPQSGWRSFWRVWLVSTGLACLGMALTGPKEGGNAFGWTEAYVAATAVSASWSMGCVALAKGFAMANTNDAEKISN